MGGEDELHEFALLVELHMPSEFEGDGLKIEKTKSAIVVQWHVEPSRRVVRFGDVLEVHILWRNSAYNYWVLDLPAPKPLSLHVSPSRAKTSVIVKAGYLLRSASIHGDALHLTGDINATTKIEFISTPSRVDSLFFNGIEVNTISKAGRLSATITYQPPNISLPNLKTLDWRYINSLPEVEAGYDGNKWTLCNKTGSNNPRKISTPTSLYASDYGYHAGSLLYRGAFIANGSESSIYILTEGGYAFAHSVWLNSTYLGSWAGSSADMFYNQTLPFPDNLQTGATYILTILIDHMGLDENFLANVQIMKDPRGILDYNLNGRDKCSIAWKITGNLGGERYYDKSRGPLNEGAIFAERQGYHLPSAPIDQWVEKYPLDELQSLGVGFFATSFDLAIPAGYDVPISVVFSNTTLGNTSTPARFRSELFINGWQFGRYGTLDIASFLYAAS